MSNWKEYENSPEYSQYLKACEEYEELLNSCKTTGEKWMLSGQQPNGGFYRMQYLKRIQEEQYNGERKLDKE